jgi:hypothetical protein
MRMQKIFAIALALAAVVNAAAYKAVFGIAPPLDVGGDLSSDLVSPFQTAMAEILSWEASLVPGLRVVDPGPLASSLEAKGWSTRTDLTGTEVEDARMAGQQQDADAVIAMQVLHSGNEVNWKIAMAYRQGTDDRSLRFQGVSGEDVFMVQIRQKAISFLDSLGVDVPTAARQMATDRGRVPWEALLEYARGIRDQQAGQIDDALRHLREANRRAPLLTSLQYRLKKLERDNPGR